MKGPEMDKAPVLSVRDLVVEIPTRHGILRPVDRVSYDIHAGEILGVVGESGAGKSMTGNAVIGLLDPPARITHGEILLSGQPIHNIKREALRKLRGKKIGMIFQDPLTSLNPLLTIGDQLTETILEHLDVDQREAKERAIYALEEVGIPAARDRIGSYPHEFSGGMRQRVVIALALCAEPELVIADEPTTALDVSVQAQIVALLKRLCRGARRGGDARHPRYGRDCRSRRLGRGDVRRATGRNRPGARGHNPSPSPLYRRAHGLDAHGQPRRQTPAANPRRHAAAGCPAPWLRLPSAL